MWATLVKVLHRGFLLQHLQREVALSDGWRSSSSQFSNPEMARILRFVLFKRYKNARERSPSPVMQENMSTVG